MLMLRETAVAIGRLASFEQAAHLLLADELFEEGVVAGLVAETAGGDGGADAQALGEGGYGGRLVRIAFRR